MMYGSYDEATIGLTAFYAGYMITFYGMMLAFSIVAYVLQGKALSAIARRRGIERPWLAWVPVANAWLLGCISDQYRYLVHNQERNKRTQLLWLEIGLLASTLVICGLSVAMIVIGEMVGSDAIVLMISMVMILLSFALLAVAIVYSVQAYKAYYDLFRSCDPDKSLVFLLVSIFASYPLPFFLYSCRNKDLGMPPRHPQPLEN